MMASKELFLRFATPNERRCISREDLGYYNVVVVGGIYLFKSQLTDVDIQHRLLRALRRCVQEHGCLAVIVKDANTERPFFQRVEHVDLAKHIDFIALADEERNAKSSDDAAYLSEVLPRVSDTRLTPGIPSWKVTVYEMLPASASKASRYFISFAFSHTFADGVSGLAFHRSLVRALECDAIPMHQTNDTMQTDSVSLVQTTNELSIAEPFDTKARLPISWLYMLTPILAVFLPEWLSRWLGLRAAASVINVGTWTGSPMFYEALTLKTRVSVLEIDSDSLSAMLTVGKHHHTKLTAILHGLVVRALSVATNQFHSATAPVTNLVATTAVNMRRSIDISDDKMGLFVSGEYEMHPKAQSSLEAKMSPEFWIIAQNTTKSLAECAVRLIDQPIGLLRYLPSIRSWTQGKLGKKRDASYEISNLGVFDMRPTSNPAAKEQQSCVVEKMVFCQPANVTSAPIVFNVVSVKGSSLICAIQWQAGALGVAENQETEFADIVRHSIEKDIASFAP